MRLCLVLTACLSFAVGALADDAALPDAAAEFEFLPTTPGVHGGAAGAFAAPAAWALNDRAGTAFWWDDRDRTGAKLENWGFSWGRNLGLAVQHRTYAAPGGHLGVTDWQLGWARGGRNGATALAWRWHTGDGTALGREKHLVFSAIRRPLRHLSLGLNLAHSVESPARAGVVDAGLRPFGTPALTFFGDYALRNGLDWDGGAWSVGAAVRPVPGLSLAVRLRDVPGADDLRTTFAVGVTLGGAGLHALPAYDENGDHAYTSYLFETQVPRSPLPVSLSPFGAGGVRYVALDLHDRRLTYTKDRWFDDARLPWLDLARLLDALLEDDDVDGVAVNLAGFTGRPSLIWEFRAALAKLREAGKEVVVHVDRAGFLLYGLASVADDLSIDPQGMVTLPGVDLSRTYLKDLLAKLGLGFEALQYFDHKTAVESLSRRDMSPADREQRGRIVDVIYEEVRAAVTDGRGLDDAAFDAAVDEAPVLTPAMSLERGLADRIARWHRIPEWLETERGATLVGPDPDLFRVRYDDAWGTPPHIAVVYALGECAMDAGIRGRATGEYLEGLIRDPRVAAVVLRADSPGGDPLPSDLVADAVRRLKEAGKPVVISQGDVAASGGYWISMDGSEILTTPLTITGSIGVISGWIWDDTLHEKAGVAVDGVSRGRHADAFRPVRYPLLGVNVPARALTPEESAYYKDMILQLYDEFVIAVAEGRGLDEAAVREIGGGRVWMGGDAVGLGLCDGLGGLIDAVDSARRLAGLAPNDEVELTEYPPRRLFRMPSFGPSLPGFAIAEDGVAIEPEAPTHPTAALVRLLAEMNGRPGLLLLPGALPEAWRHGEATAADAP